MLISAVNLFTIKNQNLNSQNKSSKVSFKNTGDMVSFSSRKEFETDITPEFAKTLATKLSTSTSGLRSPYGSEMFNAKTTALLTQAIAAKVLADKGSKVVIVGGDMRQASRVTGPQIAKQMRDNGFNVLFVEKPVATPILALAAKENDTDVTFLLTASHNDWRDGGYNLLTRDAAVADPKFTDPIVGYAVKIAEGKNVPAKTGRVGQIIPYDPYPLYKEYLDTHKINGQNIIDFNAIKDSGINIFYDDFGGTGSYYLPRLLEDNGIEVTKVLRTHTTGPEPNAKNMSALATEVSKYPSALKIGLANDGDSDRFGIIDEQGNYINANDVLLLMAYHLNKNKGYDKGAILRSCATTSQLDLFAKKHGLDLIVMPVGFKYIGEEMIKLEKEGNRAVLGGEESGGMTIGGHIPEKDGFIATLGIAELVAKERKPLSQILKDLKAELGVVVENSVKYYAAPNKQAFLDIFTGIRGDILRGERSELFGMPVDAEKTQKEIDSITKFKKNGDGVKIYFENGSSILARLSGTEDKAKVYVEIYSTSPEEAAKIKENIEDGLAPIAKVCGAKEL